MEFNIEDELDEIKKEIELEMATVHQDIDESIDGFDIEDENSVLGESSIDYFKHQCEDVFQEYRYIIQDERFFNIHSGEYYSSSGFNARVPGNFPMYEMGHDKEGNVKVKYGKAANAFLNGEFYHGIRADRKYFDSGKTTGYIHETPNGVFVNVYRKSGEGYKKGDPQPFLDLMDILFEDAEDKQLMLKIMKWVVHYAGNPRKRLTFAPFITGIEGNGKSTIVSILAQLVGREYMAAPSAKALQSEFNGFMVGKFLVNIDELPYTGNSDYAERLKEWITQPFISIRQMKMDAYQAQNIGNFFITSNHASALMQSAENTRFCNFKTRFATQDQFLDHFGGLQKKNKWYADFYDWLENKSGYAIINWFLRNQISFEGFIGNARAPKTKKHDFLLGEQADSHTIAIREAIEDIGKVFTKADMISALRAIGAGSIPPKIFNEKMVRMKYWNKGGIYNRLFKINDGSLQGKTCRLYAPADMSDDEVKDIYAKVLKEKMKSEY